MTAQTIVTLIQIVITITAISVFGIFLALLSYFLDFCFYKGNVFGFWLPFLAKQIIRKKMPEKYAEIESGCFSRSQKVGRYIHLVEDSESPLYKMLGGCIVCFNIWCGIVTFPAIAVCLDVSLWYYPIYLLSASYFLRKVIKND